MKKNGEKGEDSENYGTIYVQFGAFFLVFETIGGHRGGGHSGTKLRLGVTLKFTKFPFVRFGSVRLTKRQHI